MKHIINRTIPVSEVNPHFDLMRETTAEDLQDCLIRKISSQKLNQNEHAKNQTAKRD